MPITILDYVKSVVGDKDTLFRVSQCERVAAWLTSLELSGLVIPEFWLRRVLLDDTVSVSDSRRPSP
jgi:hypothetical protein